MFDNLFTIVWFLLALGVLVSFHEFGHYYIARRCGVKVLRFSVGFGSPIATWVSSSGTRFTIAAIPLGGFVKMLDEREGEVPEALLSQAFNRKSVWQRIAIVAAGPVANFILAVILFWLVFIPGSTGVSPVIGEVIPGSVAESAGLEAGQEFIAIDGQPTPTRQAVNSALLKRLGETGTIDFVVSYPDSNLEYELQGSLAQWLKGEGDPNPIKGLGFSFYYPDYPAVITQVVEDSPASRAGFEIDDELVAADGEPLADWLAWVEYVRDRPGVSIGVTVLRGSQPVDLTVVPESLKDGDQFFGRVGLGANPPEWPESMIRHQDFSIFEAFAKGVHKTWETSEFVLISVKKLIFGEISTKNLSGPITIAKVAGASAKAGYSYYIGFLALLSVSLGVFNLLPIPVLDGGHLLYYFVEAVKGSPVSERVQIWGYQMGLMLVFGLMALAIYNDFMRL